MNTRVLLFTTMLMTTVIAFSGVFADTTGIEVTESAQAVCTGIPDPEDPTGNSVCAEKYYCPVLYDLFGRPCLR